MLKHPVKMFIAIVVAATLMTAAAQELYGALARIDETGVINVGHRESSVPFAYINDEQQPEGYSIDLCMRVVEAVEARLGKEVEVNFVPVNPQTRIPLIANSTIDIECGSTTNNLTRQQQVDYSHTTFITGTKLLVRADSGIQEVEDLDGKVVALAQGTTNERVIKAMIEEMGYDTRVINVSDHAEGFLALETDRVDAYSTDHILLYGLIATARDPEAYDVVGRFLSYDPYALMVGRDDSEFRLLVNTTLSELFRSGEILEIYNTWFDPLGVPPTDLLEAAFSIQALPE
ncbi:MAG: amino acid ABC transporter substrate-binding protein [Deinococcota bacterium]